MSNVKLSECFKRFVCFALIIVMTISAFNLKSFATNDNETEEAEIDMPMATTMALLFVLSNLDNTAWNMSTSIAGIVPLYDSNDAINGYCVNLKTGQINTGYVVVSTDPYMSLIQEYSDTATLLVDNNGLNVGQNLEDTVNATSHIYFAGPLSYSTSKNIITISENEIQSAENTAIRNNNYQYACRLISDIKETGILPIAARGYISDPLVYLAELYPNCVYKNNGYYNMGDSSIYGYIINETNGCGVYGTAAIIEHYLRGVYSYSTIVTRCKTIARNNGYATYSSELGWDYYIDLGDLAPYVRDCLNYYGMNKTASSSLLSWSTGTSEISNNRPILLNIAFSGQYEDHTVTAYAWTTFYIYDLNYESKYFKIKDGHAAENRYVCYNTVTGSYITKIY